MKKPAKTWQEKTELARKRVELAEQRVALLEALLPELEPRMQQGALSVAEVRRAINVALHRSPRHETTDGAVADVLAVLADSR